jgi:glycosyltransferase involved in cell wall biosynthesis
VRVGIDGRSLVGAGRGVARYTRELLAALAARFPEDEWRVLVPRGHAALPADVEAVGLRRPGRLLHGTAALTGRPRLDRLLGPVDVVWLPAPAPVALSGDVPYVLTLHDLSFELRPADFSPYERAWHVAARPRRLAADAALVLAVSDATRSAAIARWGLDPARVQVAHQVVRGPAWPRPQALPGAYLLFVGALEPRKAPDLLARAFHRARDQGLEVELVVVGDGRLRAHLERPGVRLLGRVDDAELAALYAGARALVAPSWLEGFGLGPLEAALHGTPAVVTDLPAFRETLDGAALFVAPGDEAALAGALVRIVGDAELRARLGARARAAASAFGPEPAARAARAALAEAAAR